MAYKNQTPIPVDESGTGVSSVSAYSVVCGGTTSTSGLQTVSGLGTSGQILTSQGASALPQWANAPSGGVTTIDGDSGSVTGSTVTITGGSSGAVFSGSGSTLTESFNYLQLPASSFSFGSAGYISFSGDAGASVHETGGSSNIFVGSGAGFANASSLSGTNNSALGQNALNHLTSGTSNVAIGSGALSGLTTGTQNLAIGYNALSTTNSAGHNMAFGDGTLSSLFSGSYNIAIGNASLSSSGGDSNNICLGEDALSVLNGGNANICMGFNSLGTLATGAYNVAIGDNAGAAYTGAESSNILLNTYGTASESNTLRIGDSTGTGNRQLQAAYISGIAGVTTVVADAVPVLISASTGQLGTVSSSIRYKENVKDMGDRSSLILDLRPVIFDFKDKPNHKKQFGLIAEEVEEVMPSLVIYNQDGLVETVKYHELPVLLLNELQKALKRIDALEAQLKG